MSVEDIVKKYKYTDLNGDEIKKAIGKSPMLYSDLGKFKNIEQLCPREAPYQILLLQVTNKLSGHYVAIWVNYEQNYIYYFDSYGYGPDQAIKMGLVRYDQQNYPLYLSMLLQKSKMTVHCNSVDFQSKQDVKVSTCGRWSSFAIKCRHLFIPNRFYQIFRGNKSEFLNDQDNLITLLTLSDFNNFNLYWQDK